jgi:FlaA1/EpsC-like NDP-sugar epimerase
VLILDMGDPVRIYDVAKRFADLHDPPIEIVFTGLRPNEKLHEDLIASTELGERRVHPLITHVAVDPLAPLPVMLSGPIPTFDEVRAIALSGLPGRVDA